MFEDASLLNSAALRVIETRAAAALGDAFELMRRAGQAAWRELLDRWPQAQRIVVFCGPGNNGGDGYVLARHAQVSGRDVRVVHLAEHAPMSELARRASDEYTAVGGRVTAFTGRLPPADVVVDALFGIGLSRAPEARVAELIEALNMQTAPVLALDVPSGIDADRGSAPGAAVFATTTLEFIACKQGLSTGAALDHVGERVLVTLDVPSTARDVAATAERLATHDLMRWLRPRQRNSHKGAHGRVLCMGGDHGSGGAIMLCAEAALRSGAGLVEVATRDEHVPAVLVRVPEAMAHAAVDVDALLSRADAIAIGPGLGQNVWGKTLLTRALAVAKPMLLDADALNLLVAQPQALPVEAILTPHPGEAARLLGISAAEVQRDRFDAARQLCERFACAIVLKGAGTIVTAPHVTPRVIAAGNPGMAVGGMGDALSGVIVALRAQGLPSFDAASAGALLHAVAGDAAAREGGERGLLPTDLMPWLRRYANPEYAR